MLLWQRKKMPKLAFGMQLSFVIVCMHAIAFLLLCMHSVSVHDELHVIASHSYLLGADIIVVPFQKTVKQLPVTVSQSVSHDVQSETTVFKDMQRPVQKKAVPVAKKIEPEKPAKPEPSSKKRAVEKTPAQENKVDPKPQIALPAQPVTKQSASTTPATPQYIGTRQLHTLQIQRAIVEQVQIHWHPPEGLEPDLEVVLAVHICSNGEVADVNTQQSSGVFAYDVHARSAVYEMQFPKACWGKTITIAFN